MNEYFSSIGQELNKKIQTNVDGKKQLPNMSVGPDCFHSTHK